MTEEHHKTTIRIPQDLNKAARIKAIEMDTNLSEMIREFLRLWVAGEIELSNKGEKTEQG